MARIYYCSILWYTRKQITSLYIFLLGADLFNMVNLAATEAAKKHLSKIPMHLLEDAKDNVSMGPIRKSLMLSDLSKRNTAFHEAGHALVALNTPGYGIGQEIEKATILPRQVIP
jgi:ATP-dependent Zn protease